MKARIKKTGEIVNLASYATLTLEQCDSWGNPIEVKPEEIELIQEPTEDEHWQNVRERAAIAAMQGILCAPIVEGVNPNPSKEHVAELAVAQADALIAELKKK